MKLSKIEMGHHYVGYGEGAVPGIQCKVELQTGDRSYQTVEITLTHDETREVVMLAVAKAMTHLTLDPETIVITGHPGTPKPDPVPAKDQAADEMVPL